MTVTSAGYAALESTGVFCRALAGKKIAKVLMGDYSRVRPLAKPLPVALELLATIYF